MIFTNKISFYLIGEFSKNSALHVLLFLQKNGGSCRGSQFPEEWDEDILHGTLEVLCRNETIKKRGVIYSLMIPSSFINKRNAFRARNDMRTQPKRQNR